METITSKDGNSSYFLTYSCHLISFTHAVYRITIQVSGVILSPPEDIICVDVVVAQQTGCRTCDQGVASSTLVVA